MGRLPRNVGRYLLVLLFLVAVAEVLFGTWVFTPDFGGLDITRGQRRVADTAALYPGGGRMVYTRDDWGLRGPYPDPPTIDILALGGGTTDEPFVGDGATWVDGLRRRFAAAGRPLVVVNAGFDGHGTGEHLAALDHWLPRVPDLRARHVLVLAGWEVARRRPPPQPAAGWLGLLRAVEARSALAGFLSAARDAVGPLRPALPPRLAHLPAVPAPLVAAHGRRVMALVEKIRALGAAPVIATQPAPAGDRAQAAINAETLRACATARGLCLDLAGAVTLGRDDLFGGGYTTPAGSDKVAAALYALLAPHVKSRPADIPRPVPSAAD